MFYRVALVSCIPIGNISIIQESSSCSTTSLALGSVNIFNFSHSNRSVDLTLYMVLLCISLMVNSKRC